MNAISYEYKADSESDSRLLAARLAACAEPGSVLALDGDLGAGKTFFSQAFAQALGVDDTVNSPTFTLIKEYRGQALALYHMDLYRISEEEADELGLDDYFYGQGVCLVEWATRIGRLLPEAYLEVAIAYTGSQQRHYRLTPYGSRYERWCDHLQQEGVILRWANHSN